LEFRVEHSWDGQEGGSALFKQGIVYHFDSPKEFGGKAAYPSPEELFFCSVGACLITSFLYFRKKLNFSIKTLKVSVKGKFERVGDEGHRITGLKASILVEMSNKMEEGRMRKCFDLTKKFCPLTRTLENCIPIKMTLKQKRFKVNPHET
jgi:uncharacterized OsmC-like protein